MVIINRVIVTFFQVDTVQDVIVDTIRHHGVIGSSIHEDAVEGVAEDIIGQHVIIDVNGRGGE